MDKVLLLAAVCVLVLALGLWWRAKAGERPLRRTRNVAMVRQRISMMKSLRRLAGDEDNATAVLRQHAARLGVPSFSVEAMAAAIETLENDRRWLIRRAEHVNRR